MAVRSLKRKDWSEHTVNEIIGVLDTRNGHVANVLDELRNDDSADVVPQMWLELEVALAIERQVFGETLDVLTELNVERVVGILLEETLELVDEFLTVWAVLLAEEAFAVLAELAALGVALVLHDVARLLQDFAGVGIHLLEPGSAQT